MTRKYHKDGTVPDPDFGLPSIWVFGSNTIGQHAGGAAAVAAVDFGADWGVGYGRTGDSFAIPTADALGVPRPLKTLGADVRAFLHYVERHPGLLFFVTRIGCGIVGYTDAQIAPLFKDAPANCDLPESWREWVE